MDFSFITRIVQGALRLRPKCTQVVAETYKGRIFVVASEGKFSAWTHGMV